MKEIRRYNPITNSLEIEYIEGEYYTKSQRQMDKNVVRIAPIIIELSKDQERGIRNQLETFNLHPLHNMEVEKNMIIERSKKEMETGMKFEIDHIYPIIHGGPHHHDNLQLIPRRINIQKKDRLDYFNPTIKHWSEIPTHLLEWVDNRKEMFDKFKQSVLIKQSKLKRLET